MSKKYISQKGEVYVKRKFKRAIVLTTISAISTVALSISQDCSFNIKGMDNEIIVHGLRLQEEEVQKKIDHLLSKKESHELSFEDELNRTGGSTMEWNLKTINMDSIDNADYKESSKHLEPIKVAIIDSGIDYTSDIDVYCRKNFIPNEDNISVVYEDLCGHGTSVAGIIAAKDNNDGATGINSNVQLYSARELDANCSAPVSRVVEAIQWAIDKHVNIINISFGTTEDSEDLHAVIKEAEEAGILVIAAAGNNGTVEYPAAYDEVMSVGSVNSKGIVSDFSATGEELEIVAPGEMILSTGDFGGLTIESGTSMSSPHIAGVASLLWQKNPNVSAKFIRNLLDVSANLYGDKKQYGNGLVDADYAFDIYDDFKKEFYEAESERSENIGEENLFNNKNKISVFDANTYVKGSWTRPAHQNLVINNNVVFSSTDIKAIKAGCTANDNFISGMTSHPQWHGYWQKKLLGIKQYECNYVASYIYLTKMAQRFPNNSNIPTSYSDPSQLPYMTSNDYKGLKGVVKLDSFNGTAWSTALKGYNEAISGVSDTNRNRRLFMYGVAIHSATDAWAHSTYTKDGNYISHTDGDGSWEGAADNTGYLSRYDCAGYMVKLILSHANSGIEGSAEDFCKVASSNYYQDDFWMKNLDDNIKNVDSSIYNRYQTIIHQISYL